MKYFSFVSVSVDIIGCCHCVLVVVFIHPIVFLHFNGGVGMWVMTVVCIHGHVVTFSL